MQYISVKGNAQQVDKLYTGLASIFTPVDSVLAKTCAAHGMMVTLGPKTISSLMAVTFKL